MREVSYEVGVGLVACGRSGRSKGTANSITSMVLATALSEVYPLALLNFTEFY